MGYRDLFHNIIRVAFAATGVVAMTYQYAKLNGLASFSPGNFFSFFTIQSNILAATLLVLTALIRRGERTRAFDAVRGAATFYITITFIVFALLLSGLQEDLDTHIAFTNFVVHYLIPVALLVDWFIDPPRHRLGRRSPWPGLHIHLPGSATPSFVGARLAGYPYPFVDVTQHGYGGVLARGLIFSLAFAIGAVIFTMLSDRRSSRTAATESR